MMKRNKGITLVALIITIVVILILAGVTVEIVIDSGIIESAKTAKEKKEGAQEVEEEELQKAEDYIEYVVEGAKPGEIVTERNAIYMDNTGKAIIPVGFAVVVDPDTIENGLVISDTAGDDMENSKGGNQFVWIPVPDYSKFKLIEGYWNGELDVMLTEGIPVREAGDTETAGSPLTDNNVAGTAESIAMYDSVKENKGFYIARFEAGIDEKNANGNQIDNNQLKTKTLTNGTVKPLSKKGIGVWNTIAWGGTTSAQASDGLQGNDSSDGAVKVARSMYTKNAKCGVNSTLCYGVQWDAVMNFIDSNYYEGKCSSDSFVVNSSGAGNYSQNLALTGAYETKHIYDLAGNVYEWTMEAYDSDERVRRGGNYFGNGFGGTASVRYTSKPDYNDFGIRISCDFISIVNKATE